MFYVAQIEERIHPDALNIFQFDLNTHTLTHMQALSANTHDVHTACNKTNRGLHQQPR